MRSLSDRFAYHSANEDQRSCMAAIRTACLVAATVIDRAMAMSPERDQAIDHLEQAMFVGNAGVARGSYVPQQKPAHRDEQQARLSRRAVTMMIANARRDGILAPEISDEAARAVIIEGLVTEGEPL